MSVPFSTQYDDIYFSAHDGLAEKKYVFQNGNDLPARFHNRDDFVIAEAGFGTGLSFLATVQTFLAHTQPHQHLHFISFEQHPMTPEDMRAALSLWRADLGGWVEDLIAVLPLPLPGPHRITLYDRVHLTLVYGDITQTIATLNHPVDAWYLDGFTPAKNPKMWGDQLFDAMRRCSAHGATAATYSAARMVRDGLERAGFTVHKTKGFGYKSDMIRATYAGGGHIPLRTRRGQRIAVLGGGLAGTSAAWACKQTGQIPTIIAPHGLADGASGNVRGLYNPRFSKNFTDTARFYSTAFAGVHAFLKSQPPDQTGWIQNGALHLIRPGTTADKLMGMSEHWGWGPDHARIIPAPDIRAIAGIPIAQDALWLPHAGSVSPQKLCATYAEGIEVRPDTPDLSSFDAVVVASGLAALTPPGLHGLPLRPVRGQVVIARATDPTRAIQTNLCYGGYMTPLFGDDTHVIGATFTRGDTGTDVRDADTTEILDKMTAHLSLSLPLGHVVEARAGVRVTTPDHRPLIGRPVPSGATAGPPVFLSLGHGSHGILSSHLGAYILADQIMGINS